MFELFYSPPPTLCSKFLCKFLIHLYNLIILIHVWCDIIIPQSNTLSLKPNWRIPLCPHHLGQKLHNFLPQFHPLILILLMWARHFHLVHMLQQ